MKQGSLVITGQPYDDGSSLCLPTRQHGLLIQNLDHKLNLLMGLRSAYQHGLLIQNLDHKFNLLEKKKYLGSKDGDREQRWYLDSGYLLPLHHHLQVLE
jgi:hypothetical protein